MTATPDRQRTNTNLFLRLSLLLPILGSIQAGCKARGTDQPSPSERAPALVSGADATQGEGESDRFVYDFDSRSGSTWWMPPHPDSPEPRLLRPGSDDHGTGARITAIGEPVAVGDLPAGWPPSIPLPPGMEIERMTPPDEPMAGIRGHHPAYYRHLGRWFASHLSDSGWLVDSRAELGWSVRIRMANDWQRWLVAVGEETDEAGNRRSWVTLRRRTNEPPLHSTEGIPAGSRCHADLPTTTPAGPVRCDLQLGPGIAPLHSGVTTLDAAVSESRTGVLFLSGREFLLLVLDGSEIELGPMVLGESRLDQAEQSSPQILSARGGGWLTSWVDGDPPERLLVPYDSRGRRTSGPVVLSRDLGPVVGAGWSRALGENGAEYRTAWTEQSGEDLAWRVAGIQVQGTDHWRSGRFLFQGSVPVTGPILASDDTGGSAMAWAREAGLFLCALGADGLPDGPEHLVEPGRPDWLGIVHDQESYWLFWSRDNRGFWNRTDREGCADNARGSLQGRPCGAWSTGQGVMSLVQGQREMRLVRVADRGLEEPDRDPEVLGTFPGVIEWCDLEPVEEGLKGLVRTSTGYALAEWRCQ